MKPTHGLRSDGRGDSDQTPLAATAKDARAASPNADLVGRTFSDGASLMRVTGLSATNHAHVIVERGHDGYTCTIPAGVVRLCLPHTRRRRAA